MVEILLLKTPALTVRCSECGAVLTYAPDDVRHASYVRSGRWYRVAYVECSATPEVPHHAILEEEWEA